MNNNNTKYIKMFFLLANTTQYLTIYFFATASSHILFYIYLQNAMVSLSYCSCMYFVFRGAGSNNTNTTLPIQNNSEGLSSQIVAIIVGCSLGICVILLFVRWVNQRDGHIPDNCRTSEETKYD